MDWKLYPELPPFEEKEAGAGGSNPFFGEVRESAPEEKVGPPRLSTFSLTQCPLFIDARSPQGPDLHCRKGDARAPPPRQDEGDDIGNSDLREGAQQAAGSGGGVQPGARQPAPPPAAALEASPPPVVVENDLTKTRGFTVAMDNLLRTTLTTLANKKLSNATANYGKFNGRPPPIASVENFEWSKFFRAGCREVPGFRALLEDRGTMKVRN